MANIMTQQHPEARDRALPVPTTKQFSLREHIRSGANDSPEFLAFYQTTDIPVIAAQMALENITTIPNSAKFSTLQFYSIRALAQQRSQKSGRPLRAEMVEVCDAYNMTYDSYELAEMVVRAQVPTPLLQQFADSVIQYRDAAREEKTRKTEELALVQMIAQLNGKETLTPNEFAPFHTLATLWREHAAQIPEDAIGITSNDIAYHVAAQPQNFPPSLVVAGEPIWQTTLRVRSLMLQLKRAQGVLDEETYNQEETQLTQQRQLISKWEKIPQLRIDNNLEFRTWVYTTDLEIDDPLQTPARDIARAMITRHHSLATGYNEQQLTQKVAQARTKIRNESGQMEAQGNKFAAARRTREGRILSLIEARGWQPIVSRKLAENLAAEINGVSMATILRDLTQLGKQGELLSHRQWLEQQIIQLTQENKGVIPPRLELTRKLGVTLSTILLIANELRQPDAAGTSRLPAITGHYSTTDRLLIDVSQALAALENRGESWINPRRGNEVRYHLVATELGLPDGEDTVRRLFVYHGAEITVLLSELRANQSQASTEELGTLSME